MRTFTNDHVSCNVREALCPKNDGKISHVNGMLFSSWIDEMCPFNFAFYYKLFTANITFQNFAYFVLEFLFSFIIIFEKSTEYLFSSHNPDQSIKISMKTKSKFIQNTFIWKEKTIACCDWSTRHWLQSASKCMQKIWNLIFSKFSYFNPNAVLD